MGKKDRTGTVVVDGIEYRVTEVWNPDQRDYHDVLGDFEPDARIEPSPGNPWDASTELRDRVMDAYRASRPDDEVSSEYTAFPLAGGGNTAWTSHTKHWGYWRTGPRGQRVFAITHIAHLPEDRYEARVLAYVKTRRDARRLVVALEREVGSLAGIEDRNERRRAYAVMERVAEEIRIPTEELTFEQIKRLSVEIAAKGDAEHATELLGYGTAKFGTADEFTKLRDALVAEGRDRLVAALDRQREAASGAA